MQFDNINKPVGITRLKLALNNSVSAIKWLLKNESAFKQEIVLLFFSITIATMWSITLYERLALVISVLGVIFAEIVNTAIEACIDRISLDINSLSGLAKDLGSAAVFIAITICILVWASILISNLY
ncbi:diacylglycerol kinase [Planctobacterium marinum]|uniref:diacylglycerol kinase n=1 Tax=Planctobacterium marinum TaxID=1631968 RepID=UPI001E397D02|nr:diacylglycerol kinase [Planctobacterium marinum]MCC2604668.1 diacylglycerol kinase [Planctobacterium marinum]